MDVRAFQTKLFEKGYEFGYTDMEVYYQVDRDNTVKVFKGDIDSYNIAERGGLTFRGVIDGKMGYSYTEKIDDDSIDMLLREACNNAAVIESEDQEELFVGSDSYRELKTYSDALVNVSPEQMINAAIEMERTALAVDPRIDLINYCQVSNHQSELMIINTKGLNCHSVDTAAVTLLSAIAKENGVTTSAAQMSYALNDIAEINFTQIAETVAKEAVSKLGAEPIESDNYPVILRNEVAASLLSSFSSVFSGDSVEKGLSRLQGKLGEQVAGNNITIVDDPFLPSAPGCTAFDSEGYATSRHEVIKDGKLLTFLHNLKSAKKAGVQSTGNAYKINYRSSVSIAPNNLFIEPGETSLDDLIAGTERGLLIVELHGLHSGTNAVSGNFSLSCIGHLIENGKVVRPVNQVTVSGNIFELMNNVEQLGEDLRFNSVGRGACGSPSLKVKSLAISGK